MDIFFFATCQVGAEKMLKAEIAREHPHYHSSYSRPGFVTFKVTAGALLPDFKLRSVFARTYAVSLGKVNGSDENAGEQVIKILNDYGAAFPMHLHVYEKDARVPGEESAEAVEDVLAKAAFSAVLTEAPEKFHIDAPLNSGDWVLDVVVVSETEWWVGAHKHHEGHLNAIGGKFAIADEPKAPSRAYYKFEEAVAATDLKFREGQVVVELGCSPGGISYGLLKRGLNVCGVDPAKMDEVVHEYRTQFMHVWKKAAELKREDLPQNIDWIVLDINDRPEQVLLDVRRIALWADSGLRGALLTLKVGDDKVADMIPQYLDYIKDMGMKVVFARQLSRNRREFFVLALTARELTFYKKAPATR